MPARLVYGPNPDQQAQALWAEDAERKCSGTHELAPAPSHAAVNKYSDRSRFDYWASGRTAATERRTWASGAVRLVSRRVPAEHELCGFGMPLGRDLGARPAARATTKTRGLIARPAGYGAVRERFLYWTEQSPFMVCSATTSPSTVIRQV